MAKRKSDQAETVEVEYTAAPQNNAPIWERHPNLVLYALGAVALCFGGWWLYKEMIVKPKQQEAVAAMWQAEQQFGRDSFNLALNNPGGGYDGFLALADKFSGTPAGEIAKYYAGVCYLNMGQFDDAIAQLDNYSAEGNLMPALKNGLLGDCYAEKEDYSKALDYYGKAADATTNEILAPYYLKKLGLLNERQGNKDAAIKAFERLRRDYPNPQSNDWRDIEKYIYRAGGGEK